MILSNLAPVMARRAQELLAAEPSVVYVSGRRNIQAQAHAMACNVVTNRHWIAQTYKHAAALQTALDQHPEATTVAQIEALLARTMASLNPDELDAISDHFRGNAVDLEPMEVHAVLTEAGSRVAKWIRECPDTKWFTMRESGEVRWHWACVESTEV